MECIGASLRAIKMYFVVGLVVTAIHAVAVQSPDGDTRWQRAVTVIGDVVSWPRLMVEAGRTMGGIRIERPSLRFSMLHDTEGNRSVNP